MEPEALEISQKQEKDRALEARLLTSQHEKARAEDIIRAARRLFPQGLALVSSFGAESAVLLHLVAGIDRNLPVIFIDTGKIFGETLRYRDQLIERLALTGVRVIQPAEKRLQERDPDGTLWFRDTDACCFVRKVEPLSTALEPFQAWITGRKRYQAETRAKLPTFEAEGARIKVNPLAGWTFEDVARYRAAHDLPPHPLIAEGYRSIGCMPCTDRVAEGEKDRAGRWRGQAKTECGIHLGLIGREAFGSGI